MHLASLNGQVAVCKLLLAAPSCDPAAKDKQGKTAAEVAKNAEVKSVLSA